ncbi:MAG: hypothetical protein OXC30_03345 [Alphaproteobacteria bacterium]|nr:hypothetical protein [Alphaproteobacteria bacterium]
MQYYIMWKPIPFILLFFLCSHVHGSGSNRPSADPFDNALAVSMARCTFNHVENHANFELIQSKVDLPRIQSECLEIFSNWGDRVHTNDPKELMGLANHIKRVLADACYQSRKRTIDFTDILNQPMFDEQPNLNIQIFLSAFSLIYIHHDLACSGRLCATFDCKQYIQAYHSLLNSFQQFCLREKGQSDNAFSHWQLAMRGLLETCSS